MKQVAFITGGSQGIGKAIAIKLAKEGMNIAINYASSDQAARDTKDEIEKLGVACLIFKASVDDYELMQNVINEVIKKFGRIDVLVNNAGTTNFVEHTDLQGMKEEFWDDAFRINVKSLFFISEMAYEHLKKVNGTIINITSVAGLTGLGSSIAYAASKAAANSITKSLARVMAPRVRVNSIAPGVVKTNWFPQGEDYIDLLAANTPMKRAARPEDIAETVFSLVKHAPYITGEIIKVDGGMFI